MSKMQHTMTIPYFVEKTLMWLDKMLEVSTEEEFNATQREADDYFEKYDLPEGDDFKMNRDQITAIHNILWAMGQKHEFLKDKANYLGKTKEESLEELINDYKKDGEFEGE